jgi:hypothetical protein
MKKIVVLFNLRTEANITEYENWAKTTDLPTVKRLQSIDSFELLKSVSMLGSAEAAPFQYIEILNINNFDIFSQEVSSEIMLKIAQEFQAFADSPMFIVTEEIN